MYFFSGKFWKTFVLALTAMATHPLLDYTNTYGLRPFLPFDGMWYYGDLLFIFDFYIDAILLAGILAGASQRLRRTMACISLIAAVAYIGVRIELRSLASARMQQFAALTPDTEGWSLLPTVINPLEWEGILKTRTDFVELRVHAVRGIGPEIFRVERGAASDIVQHAAKAESAAALLRFARFPVMRVEGMQFGYRVLIFDLRFYNEATKTALGAEVLLDPSFRVTKESLSFVQSVK
jgi:inner membrane protein